MELVGPSRGDTRHERSSTGFLTELPKVNRCVRTQMLEADVLSFTYGCAFFAMNNLCRDVLKLPSALRALAFCTALAKFFRQSPHAARASPSLQAC